MLKVLEILKILKILNEGYLDCGKGRPAVILTKKPPQLPDMSKRSLKPFSYLERLSEWGLVKVDTSWVGEAGNEMIVREGNEEYIFLCRILGKDVDEMPAGFSKLLRVRIIEKCTNATGQENKGELAVAEIIYIPAGLEYQGHSIARTVREEFSPMNRRGSCGDDLYQVYEELNLCLVVAKARLSAGWLSPEFRNEGCPSYLTAPFLVVAQPVFAKQLGLVHVSVAYINPTEISLIGEMESIKAAL